MKLHEFLISSLRVMNVDLYIGIDGKTNVVSSRSKDAGAYNNDTLTNTYASLRDYFDYTVELFQLDEENINTIKIILKSDKK